MGIEHPDITRMNRNGYLGTAEEEEILHQCYNCEEDLRRGQNIIEFYDEIFCDEECLTEAFNENPLRFGAEKQELQ